MVGQNQHTQCKRVIVRMSNRAIHASSLQTVSILHVEDEHHDAQLFQALLKESDRFHTQIFHVQRLVEARQALLDNQYDLILLDLTLPDSSGLQTLEQVHKAAPHLPIITLTGSQDEEVYQHAVQYGAEDYLLKNETDGRLISRAIGYAIERKQAQLKLEALAQTDTLTGLLNRRAFEDRLQHTMLCTERNQEVIALLFIDLDLFKCVNDQFGHHAGDTLLKEVANRLSHTVRKQDTVSRIGGDEFVIILENIQSETIAKTVARKILLSLQKPVAYNGKQIFISASIGIHLYDGKIVASIDELLNKTDHAMYEAKRQGRNTINCYRSNMMSDTHLSEESQLDFDLRQALGKEEFFLEYQPQFNANTGELVGAEALLRWQHPKQGIVTPEKFVERLENNGQILSVGEWVLHTACQQWSDWIKLGLITAQQKISVNLSPRQCQQDHFVKRIENILINTGLPPWALDLELTEGILFENSEENIQLMCELKSLGVTLTLDDFGTGFSSLSYLTQFPIDRLKVDQCFVKEILSNSKTRAIAATIINLARNLNIEVIAEGVDQIEKVDLLHQYGCHLFQGYHFSKPISAQHFQQQYHKKVIQHG